MSDDQDIVERLRAARDFLHKADATFHDSPNGTSLYGEAADEIQRLRASEYELKQGVELLRRSVEKLLAGLDAASIAAAERERCAAAAERWGLARQPEYGGTALMNFASELRAGRA